MENLRLPLLSLDIDRTIGSFFDLEFAEENNESLMRELPSALSWKPISMARFDAMAI